MFMRIGVQQLASGTFTYEPRQPMSVAPLPDSISTLKDDLASAIMERQVTFAPTIQQWICLNNLKTKLSRLEAIERILEIEKYTLVFIGTIGEGKTTAICHLFNLVGTFPVSKSIGGKTKKLNEVQELLATGSGRTTLCEVVITTSDRTYIEIDPFSAEEMENMILELCESLVEPPEIQGEQRRMFSKELDTAIRNVMQFGRTSQTTRDGDKSTTTRVDRAREELERSGLDALKQSALRNAALSARTQTRIEFSGDTDEQAWTKRTFAQVNSGEIATVAIPRRIYVHIGRSLFSESPLLRFSAVVDTKGIDENPLRKDLEEYISRDDTLCLFASNFKDAPEANVRELMRYYLSSRSKDFHHRFVLLALPHKGEPEKVNGGDGTWDVGVQVRREDIQAAFKNLGVEFFQDNIVFYDALRYYRPDANILDTAIYSSEDVTFDQTSCLNSLSAVIDRRRYILEEEVSVIASGFQSIRQGQEIPESDERALQSAVQRIKDLRDLGKRVPRFVYEEVVDAFLAYYRSTYPAWNTKHAIHRRFGTYDVRDIDIFYDAGVVAKGRNDEEMLRKFTREPHAELIQILEELAHTNEALQAFVPDLIRQCEEMYDTFVANVGEDVQEFLHQKLSPLSEESDFWQALINEKGKPRSKGETYTDNVCQTYRTELQSVLSLDTFLQESATKHWREVVTSVLRHFGETGA